MQLRKSLLDTHTRTGMRGRVGTVTGVPVANAVHSLLEGENQQNHEMAREGRVCCRATHRQEEDLVQRIKDGVGQASRRTMYELMMKHESQLNWGANPGVVPQKRTVKQTTGKM